MPRFLSCLLLSCMLAVGCATVPVITPTQAATAPEPASAPDQTTTDPLAGDTEVDSETATVLLAQTEEPAVDATIPEMSRDDAVSELSAVAFMSFGDASCVVDAVHAHAGTYDFSSPAAEQIDQAAFIELCLSGQTPPAPTQATINETDSPAEPTTASAETTTATTDEPADPFAAIAESITADAATEAAAAQFEAPVFTPGSPSIASVVLAGGTVPYWVSVPEGFETGDAAPVYIALFTDKEKFVDGAADSAAYALDPALLAEWVVISPAPVGGTWFDKRNGDAIPELVQWIDLWVDVEGGRPHLGGAGTGGTAAVKVAVAQPDAFASLTIYPGLLPEPLEEAAAQLARMRVRMWAFDASTGEDSGPGNPWLAGMLEAETALTRTGTDVKLRISTVDDFINSKIDYPRWILDELQAARP